MSNIFLMREKQGVTPIKWRFVKCKYLSNVKIRSNIKHAKKYKSIIIKIIASSHTPLCLSNEKVTTPVTLVCLKKKEKKKKKKTNARKACLPQSGMAP